MLLLSHFSIYYPLATVVLVAFVITFVLLQPYRSTARNVNITDSILILSMIICYFSIMALSIDIATVDSSFFFHLSLAMIYLSALVPLFYIAVLVVYLLAVRKKLPQKLPQTGTQKHSRRAAVAGGFTTRQDCSCRSIDPSPNVRW